MYVLIKGFFPLDRYITLRAESPSIFLGKSRKIEGDSARRVSIYILEPFQLL